MPKKKTKNQDPLACVPKARAENAYDLLGEVIDLIKEDPKRYNQHFWLTDGESSGGTGLDFSDLPRPILEVRKNMPACGTMGCVAGWVSTLMKGPQAAMRSSAGIFAAEVLGLTDRQKDHLFAGEKAGMRDHESPEEHAKRGIQHIQRFRAQHKAQLKAKRISRP